MKKLLASILLSALLGLSFANAASFDKDKGKKGKKSCEKTCSKDMAEKKSCAKPCGSAKAEQPAQ